MTRRSGTKSAACSDAALAKREAAIYIKEIWRYPVKSMAGELLQASTLADYGVGGDRLVQVRNARDKTITARTHPGLLGFKAVMGPDGDPLVDGKPWNDPEVLERVRKVAGPDAYLVRDEESPRRFDVLPLLVTTDGSIAAFGRDGRWLRPNIVIGGVPGLQEREWEGDALHIGDVVIGIHELRARCVMTTIDPDTLVQDPKTMRDIVERFDGTLALNCEVLRGGEIRVNDEVKVGSFAPGSGE